MMKRMMKASALILAAVALLTSCDVLDDLLTVEAPSRVVASDLEDPNSAGLLAASVANEFRCTHTYHATASALTGNEWRDASGNTVLNIWDSRTHDTSGYGSQYAGADCGSGQPAIYRPLSRTRWLADYTLGLLNEWTDEEVSNRSELIAEVAMYAGYTYTLFAEAMCELAFDDGPIVTPADAFNLAIARFDQSMAAGASGDVLNAARVGKARAQLDLGQTSAAASTVAAVPPGFKFELSYSNAEPVTRNKQWDFNIDDENVTIGEPYRHVAYAGVPDPRIPVRDLGKTHNRTHIPIWVSDKYPEANSPVELASWEEAQLIIAEAAIDAGNFDQAVGIFNQLHDAVGLPPYEGGMNAAELREQLIYERSAELFLEGQHLFDLRRLNIEPHPPVGFVDDVLDIVLSDQFCFDLPATEFQNNTTITGG